MAINDITMAILKEYSGIGNVLTIKHEHVLPEGYVYPTKCSIKTYEWVENYIFPMCHVYLTGRSGKVVYAGYLIADLEEGTYDLTGDEPRRIGE
jgi:hypothetical protein